MNAVAVKLPDFWVSNPAAWFAQAEAQFGLRTITGDQTKFWYVVSALDTDTATRITCFLDHPPSTEKYPAIKRLLLATFELKEEERAERLLAMELGQRKPSEVMDEMLRLSGTHQPCFLVRHLFMRLLPSSVRQSIAASYIDDMRELAQEADRVHAAYKDQPAAAGISSCDTMEVDINAVQKKRGTRPASNDATDAMCFFHRRFGANARNCRSPCTWSGNAHRGLQKQ